MNGLLACPFCRELFERSEAEQCPSCEIDLVPIERLPPSVEHLEQEAARWEANPEEDQRRSLTDLRDGRGVCLGVAIAGMGAFAVLPWVEMTAPELRSLSGYALARGPLAWLWGGAIAWFTAFVLVATRRTRRQMWGVRAILALLSSMTLVETLMLLFVAPEQPRYVVYVYEWAWGLYASLGLSVTGALLALGFGGRAAAAPKEPAAPDAPPIRDGGEGEGESLPGPGHTVH